MIYTRWVILLMFLLFFRQEEQQADVGPSNLQGSLLQEVSFALAICLQVEVGLSRPISTPNIKDERSFSCLLLIALSCASSFPEIGT